ncbi:DUF4181 domain-containing protein [Evansella sp. AB-P1]|uniref:DUF4181 domain-containing protein n=1 Tax=Evansella sp. AB-P1 TaxID=3037653 RepID=UPI00241C8FA8|nr:DUF4181 domain-containing protein [Evansella sp. AB-P1]MDG5789236.1 DUF4181 domain-containing protein [Evansella sp. AB-P1]
MGFIVLIAIIVLGFYTRTVLVKKLNIIKNSWGYKHKRKSFAALFYIIILGSTLYIVMYQDTNFFLLFPFVGSIVNITFSIEQYLFKKEEKGHILYLFDATVWLLPGITVYLLFY